MCQRPLLIARGLAYVSNAYVNFMFCVIYFHILKKLSKFTIGNAIYKGNLFIETFQYYIALTHSK